MTSKIIYIIESYCDWSDIDVIDCAFDSKEDAQAYIDEHVKMRDNVSDELYDEITKALQEEETKIEEKYYSDYDFECLRPGMKEEDYDKESEEWYNKGQKEFVEKTFNIPWENFNEKRMYSNGENIGYSITETSLYIKD